MNLAKLNQALYDRLMADATLVASASGGIRTTLGPRTGITNDDAKPFIVIALAGGKTAADFTGDLIECAIDVHIVTDCKDGFAIPSAIIDRVYGDATQQTNRQPTYGLERHPLALTSSLWASGVVEFEDIETAHDENKLHFILGFKVNMSRGYPAA